jgi:hypothetical protein
LILPCFGISFIKWIKEYKIVANYLYYRSPVKPYGSCDFFFKFKKYKWNFLNSYRITQIVYFMLAKLWYLLFFNKLVQLSCQLMCLELVIFPYTLVEFKVCGDTPWFLILAICALSVPSLSILPKFALLFYWCFQRSSYLFLYFLPAFSCIDFCSLLCLPFSLLLA